MVDGSRWILGYALVLHAEGSIYTSVNDKERIVKQMIDSNPLNPLVFLFCARFAINGVSEERKEGDCSQTRNAENNNWLQKLSLEF